MKKVKTSEFLSLIAGFSAAVFFPASLAFLHSCSGDTGKKNNADTPTQGHVRVGTDDSYSLIMDAEKFTFEELYIDAEVDIVHAPEDSMVKLLLADSIRFAVMTRKLSREEESVIAKDNIEPTYIKIAYDGVALIVNPESQIINLTFPTMKRIFRGEISSWKKLDAKSESDSIRIVFDHPGSGNARYIRDSLLGKGDGFPKNAFAVKSHIDVIKYVSQHKNALGVIGVNWVSDRDDSLSLTFLKEVRVLGISGRTDTATFYQPYQAYIAQQEYPLSREVYIVKREAGAGLGTGFAAFIAGEKGQRIILKSGLVPATMPLRLVNIRSE